MRLISAIPPQAQVLLQSRLVALLLQISTGISVQSRPARAEAKCRAGPSPVTTSEYTYGFLQVPPVQATRSRPASLGSGVLAEPHKEGRALLITSYETKV